MEKIISEAGPAAEIAVKSEKILLVSHENDDSIPRLQWEFTDHRGTRPKPRAKPREAV